MTMPPPVPESPSVSIAMCTCNGARFLGEQLDSIANQHLLPDELIIYDDCSTDGTGRVVEAFRARAPFRVAFHVNPVRMGVIRNFEAAIRACASELIALSDQDDVWRPGKLAALSGALAANPGAGYAFSDATLVDPGLKPIGSLWQSAGFNGPRLTAYAAGRQLPAMLKGGPFIYGNTLVFRASLLKLILPIGSTSRAFTHDTWISLLLSAAGHPGIAIPDPLVLYRQHPSQVAGGRMSGSMTARLARLFTDRRTFFQDYAQILAAIRERIGPGSSEPARLLDDCRAHQIARASLYARSGPDRLAALLQEMQSGRYGAFSSAAGSALRDLIATSPLLRQLVGGESQTSKR